MIAVATALWRRLDAPGHDACRLLRGASAWRLEGTAVFLDDGAPTRLDYAVTCDAAWTSRHGEVRGWRGDAPVAHVLARGADGRWSMDGAVADLPPHDDLDFSFTPATNLLHLRRVGMAIGARADIPVAWLELGRPTLQTLPQRYERRAEHAYRYEAPSVGFEALLEMLPSGFVRRYGGLWEAVTG